MLSTARGLELSESWLPRLVAERVGTSGLDGAVDRAPDPIPFIDLSMLWTNNTPDAQHLHASVHRASRTIIASNPNTVTLQDAWSFDVGPSPAAPIPFAIDNGIASRVKITRSTDPDVLFGRIFRDTPDWVGNVEIGQVASGDSVHFRYRCAFSTPSEFRTGNSPRHEAFARWARLRLWAAPWLTGSI